MILFCEKTGHIQHFALFFAMLRTFYYKSFGFNTLCWFTTAFFIFFPTAARTRIVWINFRFFFSCFRNIFFKLLTFVFNTLYCNHEK